MSAWPFHSKVLLSVLPLKKDGDILIASFEAMRNNTPRVLYIEDHDDTRELVTLVLEQRSYEVVTGTTIQSGVSLACSQQFDLYLLDSWLPDGSGLDLCRRIREFDKVTPILFYSAAAYEMDRADALQSGAQAYLVKPSQPSDLCNLVTSLIESRQILHNSIPDSQITTIPINVKVSQKVQ